MQFKFAALIATLIALMTTLGAVVLIASKTAAHADLTSYLSSLLQLSGILVGAIIVLARATGEAPPPPGKGDD